MHFFVATMQAKHFETKLRLIREGNLQEAFQLTVEDFDQKVCITVFLLSLVGMQKEQCRMWCASYAAHSLEFGAFYSSPSYLFTSQYTWRCETIPRVSLITNLLKIGHTRAVYPLKYLFQSDFIVHRFC